MFDPKRAVALMSRRYRFRDAGTGEFVPKLYALLHPTTTVSERIDLRDEGDKL